MWPQAFSRSKEDKGLGEDADWMDVVVGSTRTSPAFVLYIRVPVPDGQFQRKINPSKISREHQLEKRFQEFELHKKMTNE